MNIEDDAQLPDDLDPVPYSIRIDYGAQFNQPMDVPSTSTAILSPMWYGGGRATLCATSSSASRVSDNTLPGVDEDSMMSIKIENTTFDTANPPDRLDRFDAGETRRLRDDTAMVAAEAICVVCGDAASGFHYEVSSCNGCKTFFRRTVVAERKFICRKGGNCQFDKNRRCACRACRFKKCVDAGMNTKAIQYTPSANLTLSIVRKRFHRSFLQQRERAKNASPEKRENHDGNEPPVISNELWSVHDDVLRHIGVVLRREKCLERLRLSLFNPYIDSMTLEDLIGASNTLADAEKYQLVEKWPVKEYDPSWASDMKSTKFWLFIDLFLSVEYLKTFEIFHSLSAQEKISLVKKTAIPSASITSAYFSCQQRADVIVYPDGTKPLNQRKQDSLLDIERVLQLGVVSDLRKLQADQIQLTLIRVIVLLDDNCDQLSERSKQEISTLRQKYASVLLHYLRNRHGDTEGVRRFSETIAFLEVLSRFRRSRIDYYAYRQYVTRRACPMPMFNECMND